jgi:hypothetical protein
MEKYKRKKACKRVERYTFTILSACFINHETKRPVDPRFNTTNQVVIVYPLKMRCHQGPFSKPPLKSSTISFARLKIEPNLGKETHLICISLSRQLKTI